MGSDGRMLEIESKDIAHPAVLSRPDPLMVAEAQRMESWTALDPVTRRAQGQYFTPAALSVFIAGQLRLVAPTCDRVRILDPGAGVGSLGVALLQRFAAELPGARLHLTAVELDPKVLPALGKTRNAALAWAGERGIDLEFEIVHGDFIEWAAKNFGGLYEAPDRFDYVIMNPPYAKVATGSRHRVLTAQAACEVTNLYAAFVALAVEGLREDGRLVAITPRSFTNGPYFKAFRRYLDERVAFESVDLFESRSTLFADTDVLQENVIYSLRRTCDRPATLQVSFHGRKGEVATVCMRYEDFMSSHDPQRFIHLRNGHRDHEVARRVNQLPCLLVDLGLSVSTGKVVDFRTRENLLMRPQAGSVPLLYAQHLRRGLVTWPIEGKKPNALAVNERTRSMLVPRGHYVAIKRFSSKEEKRRVTATWVPADRFETDHVAFENHLNVIHRDNAGLDRDLAVGITLYVGSTTVDTYFRQFSGHTQVNATDLRTLRFPEEQVLRKIGRHATTPETLGQEEVDALVEKVVWG